MELSLVPLEERVRGSTHRFPKEIPTLHQFHKAFDQIRYQERIWSHQLLDNRMIQILSFYHLIWLGFLPGSSLCHLKYDLN